MSILLKRKGVKSGQPVLALIVLTLLGLLFTQGCSPSSSDGTGQPPAPEIGRLAPDFTLNDLDDNRITLSTFRGKTVFLNFWATWCPPCREEMPAIEAVYQKYKDKDVVVIGIDIGESKEVVRQFAEEGGYHWLFVLDSAGEITNDYRVTAIPTSFFIDSNGVIRVVSTGAMSQRTMEAALAEAMR